MLEKINCFHARNDCFQFQKKLVFTFGEKNVTRYWIDSSKWNFVEFGKKICYYAKQAKAFTSQSMEDQTIASHLKI